MSDLVTSEQTVSERVAPERAVSQGSSSARALPADLARPRGPVPSDGTRVGSEVVRSRHHRGVGTGAAERGHAWSLLVKAGGLLTESLDAGHPADRFRCSYLAALRGAGAVLAGSVVTRASARRRTGNAWVLLAGASPMFGEWADYFAGWSDTRAAVETGVSVDVSSVDADGFFAEVERFLTAVEEFLAQQTRGHLKAS
ncbi:hypothetical protein ABH922_002464 [Rhodococcus sp. 27YEA15]|uniref:SAV_6107 family HEPN domain-containing protein n=1 Tax=Rhodococcus sp. 27YEA15 TaxID=3156259 RepID=UPI003C7E7650